MNTKIILGLTTAVLLSSSLMAFSPQDRMGNSGNNNSKNMKMMNHHGAKSGHGFIKMFMKLNLSDKQRTQIRTILKESRKNISNPSDAFTDNSFDKKMYIKLANERKDAKITKRAEIIEKVYAILDNDQKKDLKTILNMKELMKKNRGRNAKNSNGRR